MFRNLSELEHVFEQLDNDSRLPDQEKLNWICGGNSEFTIRLTALMESIHKRELAHGLAPGKSYQSMILGDLYFRIQTCSKPSILKAYLPELKELLFKAYVISLDRRIDSISHFSYEKSQLAEYGNKFRGNKRGKNKLNKLLLELLQKHGKDTPADKIINELAECANDKHEIIHEVDEIYVYWYTGKSEKKTTIKSIQNTIYDLKKEI